MYCFRFCGRELIGSTQEKLAGGLVRNSEVALVGEERTGICGELEDLGRD